MIYSELYKQGISWHQTGTIKRGHQIVSYFIKLSKPLSVEQKEWCSQNAIRQGKSISEFAPELKRDVLCWLSKSEIKRRNIKWES